MKKPALCMHAILVGSIACFSSAAGALESSQIQWNKPAMLSIARELYRLAWQTSAIADSEFSGGAPGQDELAYVNEQSQTYLLFLEEDDATADNTLKWLTPIEGSMFRADNLLPACSPPYSDTVLNNFQEMNELLEELEAYYPNHPRP